MERLKERIKTDRRATETSIAPRSVSDRVRDNITGRTGVVGGIYGVGSRRQWLINLDIPRGATRKAADVVYRSVGEFTDLPD